MDEFDAAETVKQFWLERVESIPAQQIVMASCPFCGKTDRILVLPQSLPAESQNAYSAAMNLLARSERTVAICGFCMNIVLLKEGRGEPPSQD